MAISPCCLNKVRKFQIQTGGVKRNMPTLVNYVIACCQCQYAFEVQTAEFLRFCLGETSAILVLLGDEDHDSFKLQQVAKIVETLHLLGALLIALLFLTLQPPSLPLSVLLQAVAKRLRHCIENSLLLPKTHLPLHKKS